MPQDPNNILESYIWQYIIFKYFLNISFFLSFRWGSKRSSIRAHRQRSDMWESFSPSTTWVLGNQTQAVIFGSKHPQQLRYFIGPQEVFYLSLKALADRSLLQKYFKFIFFISMLSFSELLSIILYYIGYNKHMDFFYFDYHCLI